MLLAQLAEARNQVRELTASHEAAAAQLATANSDLARREEEGLKLDMSLKEVQEQVRVVGVMGQRVCTQW